MAKKSVISFTLFALSLAGCLSGMAVESISSVPETCKAPDVDVIVWVSSPKYERVETTTELNSQGCSYEQTIAYLHEDVRAPIIGIGTLPFGYYEAQCQWDACGGPLNMIVPISDPIE